jgi:hypothetical protein
MLNEIIINQKDEEMLQINNIIDIYDPNFLLIDQDINFINQANSDISLITSLLPNLIYKRTNNDDYNQYISKFKALIVAFKNNELDKQSAEALINGLLNKLINDIQNDNKFYKHVCYELIKLYVTGVSYCTNVYLFNKGNITQDEIFNVSGHCEVVLPPYIVDFLDKYILGLFLKKDDIPITNKNESDVYICSQTGDRFFYIFFNINNSYFQMFYDNVKYTIQKYVELFNIQFQNGPFTTILDSGTIIYRGLKIPPNKAVSTLGINNSYLSTTKNMTIAIEHATDVYGYNRGTFLNPGSSTLIQFITSGRVPVIDLSLVEEYYMNYISSLPLTTEDNLNSDVYDYLRKITGLQKNNKHNSILKNKTEEFLNSTKGLRETTQVIKQVRELINADVPFIKKVEQNYRFKTLGIWQEEYIFPIGCITTLLNKTYENVPMPKSVLYYTKNNSKGIKKIVASLSYSFIGGNNINIHRKIKRKTIKRKKRKRKTQRKYLY